MLSGYSKSAPREPGGGYKILLLFKILAIAASNGRATELTLRCHLGNGLLALRTLF